MVKITESMELEAKKSFDRLLYVSKDENKEIFLANEKRIKEIFALSDFVAAVFTLLKYYYLIYKFFQKYLYKNFELFYQIHNVFLIYYLKL